MSINYWDVPVKQVRYHENQADNNKLEDFRAKLMDVADKVENGEYTTLTMSFVAGQHAEHTLTVGQIDVTQRPDGERNSNWFELEAQVSQEELYRAAYDAYVDDLSVLFDMKPQDETSGRENCELVIGTTGSDEEETTRFVEKP